MFLTKAALLDPRMKRVNPIEQADMASMWAEVLADVDLDAALGALRTHYRAESAAIMPANVLEAVGVEDEPASRYRDIMPELEAQWKAEALAEAGVTAAEFEAHEHDVAWLRAKFPALAESRALTSFDEAGEIE